MPIDLYSWPTPNGHKVHIMLCECRVDFNLHAVDINRDDRPRELLQCSPSGKIPAIVDSDVMGRPVSLFESGAILQYLALKTGCFAADVRSASWTETTAWLMFQMSSVGPIFGQASHFLNSAPDGNDYAKQRFVGQVHRICGVLERRLEQAKYLAGPSYGIADIAVFPWLRQPERKGINLASYPQLSRWFKSIAVRPAVQRGLDIFET